jgi:hypothetical protein
MRWIVAELMKELGFDDCEKGTVNRNEFTITYKNEKFTVSRNFASDLVWKSYDISKN